MFFKKQSAILGILRLDYNYPAALGDIDCPETFNYNVIYRVYISRSLKCNIKKIAAVL